MKLFDALNASGNMSTTLSELSRRTQADPALVGKAFDMFKLRLWLIHDISTHN